jgi:hypothetical protein
MSRPWFAFALSRPYHLCRLQDDQVFCQMISKRPSPLRSNFLNFTSLLKFLFLTQPVHAKTALSCGRGYYKGRGGGRPHSSIPLSPPGPYALSTVVIISCLSRWSYCAACLWAVYCGGVHAFLRMLCLLLSTVLHQCLSRGIDVVVACLSFVEMPVL